MMIFGARRRLRQRVKRHASQLEYAIDVARPLAEGGYATLQKGWSDTLAAGSHVTSHGKLSAPLMFEFALSWLRIAWAFACCTMAVATGIIAGIGLDFIMLVDRWSILSAVALTCGVLTALLSPLLAVPRTITEVQRSITNRRRAKVLELERTKLTYTKSQRTADTALKKLDSDIARRTPIFTELAKDRAAAQKALVAVKGRRRTIRDRFRLQATHQAEIESAKNKLHKIIDEYEELYSKQKRDRSDQTRLQGELTSIDSHLTALNRKISDATESHTRSRFIPAMRHAGLILYILIAFMVLLNLVSEAKAVYLAAAFGLLSYASRKISISFAAPMVIANLLLLGYWVGSSTYLLSPNVLIEVNQTTYKKARLLFRTPDGILAIQHGDDLPGCLQPVSQNSDVSRAES